MAFKKSIAGIIFVLPLFGGTPIYLVNLGYESPKLVAPAVISIIPTDDHRLFQFGMVGWTLLLKGEFGLNKNLMVGLSQDISPINANASTYQYTEGKQDTSLNYENGSYLTQFYLKKKQGRNFSSQFSLIVRQEHVDGLNHEILRFWDGPHFGYSVSGSYRNVGFEDFFNNNWDGKKAQVQFQFFPGEPAWLKGHISGGIGKKFENYHGTVSGKYFFSDHLNIVNKFVVGGVWELELLDFLPGSHYGEYRIDQGLLFNGRFEKILSESMNIGYRSGFLSFGESTVSGHGIKVVKVYEGMVFNLGASISGKALKNNNLDRTIISAGVTFGLM